MRKKNRVLTSEEVIKKRFSNIIDKRYIINVFLRTALFIASVYIVFWMIFGISTMKSAYMMPKISAGDVLLYYRLDKEYKSSDVVIFTVDNKEYVGRIIAKGNDTISIEDNDTVLINGNQYIENEIFYHTFPYDDLIEYPVQLQSDEYFILCDYREGAKDSRYFGPINISQIKGKIIIVLKRNNL